MNMLKKDAMNAAGSLQVCVVIAICAMHDIYNDEHSEAALLVDAKKAFNSINSNAMLHNISILCPTISTSTSNCYQSAVCLFVIGGKEILSKEGTTQGNPTSMGRNIRTGGDSFTSFSIRVHINKRTQK